MAIKEEDIATFINGFPAMKRYIDHIAKMVSKQDLVLKETLEVLSIKEAVARDAVIKIEAAAKDRMKDIVIIKKEFIPLVMELMQKFQDNNDKLIKRVDSLEHQIKKINKKK